MSELRGFKFVTTLVLEFKKIESNHETKYNILYSKSNVETIINELGIDDYLNQFILRLCQTYINLLEMIRVGLMIQS